MLIRDTFPLDGEYVIKPKLWRTNVGFIRGLAYRTRSRSASTASGCTW